MNNSDLQQLLNNYTDGQESSPINQLIEPLLPMLSLFFIISIVVTVVLVVFFIINLVQKQQTHKAILRIDKNLQRLVDAQLPAEKSKKQAEADPVAE